MPAGGPRPACDVPGNSPHVAALGAPHLLCAQDEYWTSQKCHKCEAFLEDGKGHRTKVCTNTACADHGQATNRDLNAALNLQRVWDEWLAHRRRPGYLTPPDDADVEGEPGAGAAGEASKTKTKTLKTKTSSKAKGGGAANGGASAHPGAA